MTGKMEPKFLVTVRGLVQRELDLQYADFVEEKIGPHVEIKPIVPTFVGIATPFASLLEITQPMVSATHVIFHASDEFQATLPIAEAKGSYLLFQQDGNPLRKGFPVRVIVPNGSSECLNVKSVVNIEFVSLEKAEQEATYGFKNTVSAEEL